MKKLFALSVIITFTINVFSQVPDKMSYQAIIRNADGGLVTNQVVGMQISILQGSATGTPVFVETQSSTTNNNGLVTIEIGGGTVVDGIFAEIDWTNGTYFIKIETDPAGGTSYTITGTSQLLSVPYAFHSKTSETAADAVKLTGDQTISGNKNFTGSTTVQTPVNPTDAVNKSYLDNILKLLGLVPDNFAGIIYDIEGNMYKTVKIGDQFWMQENLKTLKYSNGDIISSGIYMQGEPNVQTYGRLYTWNVTVDNRNICPIGWHVPSEAEWNILLTKVNSPAELKESGTNHWFAPNTGATNSVSFTALPGGYFDGSVTTGIQAIASFWFKDEANVTMGKGFKLYYNNLPDPGDFVYSEKNTAFSVRCLKDN